MPFPFNQFSTINITKLPIDPINQPPYYYTFVAGGSYELTAALESDSNRRKEGVGGSDGGDHNFVYEAGTNKKLTPSSVQARAEPDSLKQGLVGWWTFDEGNGTALNDSSGRNNNATLSTGIWGTFDQCKENYCLKFGAQYPNMLATFPVSSDWDSPKITYTYWVRIDGVLSGGGRVITKVGPYYYTNGFWGSAVPVSCSGRPGILDWAAASQSTCPSVSGFVSNTWVFIAYTWDDSLKIVKKYFNGNFVAQRDYSAVGTIVLGGAKGILLVSEGWTGTPQNFIDEVRIYNRVLSDQEIKALYEATK